MSGNQVNALAITAAECQAAGGTYSGSNGGNTAAPCNFNYSSDNKIRSYSYYNALSQCVRSGQWNTRIADPSKPATWMGGENITVGYFVDGQDGRRECNQLIEPALKLWGYSSSNYQAALESFGYTKATVGNCTGSACNSSSNTSEWVRPGNLNTLLSQFQNEIRARLGGAPDLEGKQDLLYRRGIFHIENTSACGATAFKRYSELTSDEKTKYPNNNNASTTVTKDYLIVKVVNGTSWKTEDWVYTIKKDNWNKLISINEKPSGGPVELTCVGIANSMAGYSDRVAKDAAAMIAAGQDPAVKYASIVKTPGQSAGADAESGLTGGNNPTSCTIEGIGWIVCPIVTFISKASDALYGWISSYLKVQPLNVDTGDASNTMFNAWSVMRNIANISFVIAFIIIIYSQLTSAGVSNYGVKKLLPRLVVAAILVNVSYWIAAVAVDASNILGSALYDVLVNDIGLGTISVEANNWEALAVTLLSGGAIVGTFFAGSAVIAAAAPAIATVGPVALFAFLVFILGVVLALIIAFVILAVRQALIVILIVISPMAFVAMLLPNTEKYFTLWRKGLTTLLLFYPLFSLLFGGSYLAGMIIIGSASSANDNAATGMTVLIGMVVTALPLFLTPLIARFSSGILGQVTGMVNNKGKGLIDRTRKVRDRKAKVAMGTTLSTPNSKNPFARVYRRFQNSERGDNERLKTVDTMNETAYTTSAQGQALDFQTNLAGQQKELAGLQNKAAFEEAKSGKDLVSVEDANAAGIIAARASQEQIEVANSQVSAARSVLQQRMADRYSSDPDLVKSAAGIGGPRAESRIKASALATINDEESKAIGAEKSTMSRSSAADLAPLIVDTNQTAERRAAAAGQFLKVASDEEIAVMLDSLGGLDESTEESKATKVMIQQQVQADLGSRKPIALGAGDINALGRGEYSGSILEKAIGRINAGKISAEGLHTATADDLKFLTRAIGQMDASDPQLAFLKKSIADYEASPSYKPPSKEIADNITNIKRQLDSVPSIPNQSPSTSRDDSLSGDFNPRA